MVADAINPTVIFMIATLPAFAGFCWMIKRVELLSKPKWPREQSFHNGTDN